MRYVCKVNAGENGIQMVLWPLDQKLLAGFENLSLSLETRHRTNFKILGVMGRIYGNFVSCEAMEIGPRI